MRTYMSFIAAVTFVVLSSVTLQAQTRPTTSAARDNMEYRPASVYASGYGHSTARQVVAAYYQPTYSVTASYYTSGVSLAKVAPVDRTTYGWSERLWKREWVLQSLAAPASGFQTYYSSRYARSIE